MIILERLFLDDLPKNIIIGYMKEYLVTYYDGSKIYSSLVSDYNELY